MTTISGAKGVTTGGFWPEGTLPDYATAGEVKYPSVDRQGNLAMRGPVVTDEGGFRESFAGAALSGDWYSSAGAGSLVVSGGLLTISTPATPSAADLQYASRDADYLPVIAYILLGQQGGAVPFNLTGVAGSTMEAFFGLYSLDEAANPTRNPSHATAQAEYVEWAIRAVDTATTGVMRSSAHAGAGGTQASTGVTVTSRSNQGWRSIALDGENALYRDNATQAQALPPPTTRATHSGQIPGLYTPFFFSCGIRSGATPGASQGIFVVDALFVKNMNRLVVNTGF